MDKEMLLEKLKEMDLPYEIVNAAGGERIWVYARETYRKKTKDPIANRNLFLPYCRITFEDGGQIYIRNNGWCTYVNDNKLIDILKELAAE